MSMEKILKYFFFLRIFKKTKLFSLPMRIFFYSFFFLICIRCLFSTPSNEIAAALKKGIQSYIQPPNLSIFLSLMTSVHSSAKVYSDFFYVGETMNVLKNKLGFENEIVDQFKNIIFMESLIFQTFSITISSSNAGIVEFIGCARNKNSFVEISYIYIKSEGVPISPYEIYYTQDCDHFLFFKWNCENKSHKIYRSFSTNEIDTIWKGLKYFGLLEALKEVDKATTSLLLNIQLAEKNELTRISDNFPEKNFPLDKMIYREESPNNQGDLMLHELLKDLSEKIPEIKKNFSFTHTTAVDRIVGKGFSFFKNGASIMEFNGVYDNYFAQFMENLIQILRPPKKHKQNFEDVLSVILYSESQDWVCFEIIYELEKGGECKYINVMARHDPKKKTFWLVANILTTFVLAPDVLIITEKTSNFIGMFYHTNTEIKLVPQSISHEDLTTIFVFFRILTFERFAEVLHIMDFQSHYMMLPQLEQTSETEEKGNKTSLKERLDRIISTVSNWMSSLKTIVDAFKVTKSSEYKNILESKGFSYFTMKSDSQKIFGMTETYWKIFNKQLLRRAQLPPNATQEFSGIFLILKISINLIKEYLDSITEVELNGWSPKQFLFSDQKGDARFFSIIVNRNIEERTIDILFTISYASFTMAPNVAIIQESESDFFSSETRVRFEKLPREISKDEIEQIFLFMKVVAVIDFADLLGVPVQHPLTLLYSPKLENPCLVYQILIVILCTLGLFLAVGYYWKSRIYNNKKKNWKTLSEGLIETQTLSA